MPFKPWYQQLIVTIRQSKHTISNFNDNIQCSISNFITLYFIIYLSLLSSISCILRRVVNWAGLARPTNEMKQAWAGLINWDGLRLGHFCKPRTRTTRSPGQAWTDPGPARARAHQRPTDTNPGSAKPRKVKRRGDKESSRNWGQIRAKIRLSIWCPNAFQRPPLSSPSKELRVSTLHASIGARMRKLWSFYKSRTVERAKRPTTESLPGLERKNARPGRFVLLAIFAPFSSFILHF